jgi:hypothetical protein
MKTKRVFVLVLTLAAAGIVFADMTGDVTAVFNDFLGRLIARHTNLENLAMPGVEVRTPPETEEITQTAVILRFGSAGDQEAFSGALKAENIPYASFPNDDRELLLFTIDMLVFIMQDAIGI